MNAHLLLLPLLLALFFASKPTDGSKDAKAKNHAKPIDKVNSTLTTINTDNDIRRMSKETEGSSELAGNNATKIVEKAKYPKKVHALKKRPAKTPNYYAVTAAAPNGKSKRKKVLDVTAVFKDLPADDVEFIKELDKQFQLHGDKIKIQVVRDNSTETEKLTSKRTIDGELGYGSYQSQNGYVYERPKFMFYPYSQRSIAADVPGYYPPKTDVSIEPSYSYELQPETYVEDQHPPKVLDVPRHPQQSAPQQDEHGGYEEPVIVLRIPGPTKYASHLQTLLQQYLEIRAAQYLRILEEADKQQQQQYAAQHAQHEDHQQVYQQQEQPQHAHVAAQEYAEPTVELQPPAHEQHDAQQAPPSTAEHGYAPEENYAHQVAPTPQAVVYPEIDQVYQSYKGRLNAQEVALHQQHLQRNKQHHQHQQQEQHVSYMPQEQVAYAPQHQAEIEQPQHEQQYYVQAAQQQGAQQYYYVPVAQIGAHGSHHYQNIYFMAIAPQGAYNDHAAHEAPLQRQPIYVQEDEQGLQQQHYHEHQQQLRQHHHAHEQHELISAHAAAAADENSPRQTHTKVIYTQNAEKGAADYAGGYTLPSIRPYERHAGKSSIAAYHQQQQLQEQLLQEQQQHQLDNEQLQQHEQQRQYDYDTQIGAEHAQPSAAISPRPFNYHAHSAKPARRRNRRRGVATTTTTTTSATTTAAEDDEHLRKIREFVRENLGAKMSTAVEFKTTAIVKS